MVISATHRGGIRQKCALHCSMRAYYLADVAAESARGFTAAVRGRQRATLMHALFVWLPVINFHYDAKSWEKFSSAFNFELCKCSGCRSTKSTSGWASSENMNYCQRPLDLVLVCSACVWERACVSECMCVCNREAVWRRKTAAGGDRGVRVLREMLLSTPHYLNYSIYACVTLRSNLTVIF